MLKRYHPPIAEAVARIQARRPLRAWSLIVTIYGDAVVPRGGSLWLGSLLDMMDAFGIGGGVVRTAMSRLAKDRWIERQRIGRQSYYRLSRKREQELAAAARRIYAPCPPDWDGRWMVALLPEGPGPERRKKRASFEALGYAPFAPNVLLRPNAAGGERPEHRALMLAAQNDDPEQARRLAAALWPLDGLAVGYRRFVGWFEPVKEALKRNPPDGLQAFVLRIALIHEYRRLVLHDPSLPAALLPEDWPGATALALARGIYARLLAPSEAWLDDHALNEAGPLPPPDPALFHRFGGLRASAGDES